MLRFKLAQCQPGFMVFKTVLNWPVSKFSINRMAEVHRGLGMLRIYFGPSLVLLDFTSIFRHAQKVCTGDRVKLQSLSSSVICPQDGQFSGCWLKYKPCIQVFFFFFFLFFPSLAQRRMKLCLFLAHSSRGQLQILLFFCLAKVTREFKGGIFHSRCWSHVHLKTL